MSKAPYDVRTILLYPLDKSGLRTMLPKDAPHRLKPPQVSTFETWRPPDLGESTAPTSRRSGDEWLSKTEDVTFIYREGAYSLQADEAHRIYDAIWRNMDRENNLINQRISWSITLTAGFLTAQTFILSRVLEVLSSDRHNKLSVIAYTLMMGAFLLCFALSAFAADFSRRTKLGVDAAQRQLMYLKRRYYRLRTPEGLSLFQDVMLLPRPFGNSNDHNSGNVVAQWFPKVMIVVWALFAVVEFCGAGAIYHYYLRRPQPLAPAAPPIQAIARPAMLLPNDGAKIPGPLKRPNESSRR